MVSMNNSETFNTCSAVVCFTDRCPENDQQACSRSFPKIGPKCVPKIYDLRKKLGTSYDQLKTRLKM